MLYNNLAEVPIEIVHRVAARIARRYGLNEVVLTQAELETPLASPYPCYATDGKVYLLLDDPTAEDEVLMDRANRRVLDMQRESNAPS